MTTTDKALYLCPQDLADEIQRIAKETLRSPEDVVLAFVREKVAEYKPRFVICLPKAELPVAIDTFTQAACVPWDEKAGENRFVYERFKAWAGRRVEQLNAHLDEFMLATEAIQSAVDNHPDYNGYLQDRNKMLESFAKRDADGNPVVRREKNGDDNFVIPPENREKLQTSVRELEQKYSALVAAGLDASEQVKKLGEEKVVVECAALDLGQFPLRLNGMYLSRILQLFGKNNL